MGLISKLSTLLGSWIPRDRRHRRPRTPLRRPTPMEAEGLPLDPCQGWGIALQPADRLIQLLRSYIEQLALEAYLNGEGFQFSDQELAARFQRFFDNIVEKGELEVGPPVPDPGEPAREAWLEAQQIRIQQLVAWWRSRGGPDIEPEVL